MSERRKGAESAIIYKEQIDEHSFLDMCLRKRSDLDAVRCIKWKRG